MYVLAHNVVPDRFESQARGTITAELTDLVDVGVVPTKQADILADEEAALADSAFGRSELCDLR